MSATPEMDVVFTQLEESLRAVSETYSNVHRGSGHFSQVTTHLFELARAKLLEMLGLSPRRYSVLFCSPRQAAQLQVSLGEAAVQCLSSEAIGLAMGVRALVVKRSASIGACANDTGGGTARLVSPDWVVWAKSPHRLEAGTPAIINVIAFVRAQQLLRQRGIESFEPSPRRVQSVQGIVHDDEFSQLSGWDLLDRLRHVQLGGATQVPTRAGTSDFINLDNAASSPTFAPIWDAFVETLRQPSATQQAIVREVESICAKALGAPSESYDVIFAYNTTEAINLAARSLANESTGEVEPVVLNTYLEHNSNELPWRALAKHTLIRLTVDALGFIDLHEFEEVLQAYNQADRHGKQRIRLVAISAASNVLGTCNDIGEICGIAHRYGARVLVDAAQLVGHRRVNMERSGVDYLAFSAHKMYAPFGSGALVARKGLLNYPPDELARIRRSGEANAAGIAALGKAFVLLQRIGMDVVQTEEQLLTEHALDRLAKVPGAKIYGVESSSSIKFTRRAGVIALGLGRAMPSRLACMLAEHWGIGVRYGCHCAHLLVKRLHGIPPIIERLQWLIVKLFPKLELPGVLRVSFGIQNNREQVDVLVTALTQIAAGSSGVKRRGRSRPAAAGPGGSRREFRKRMDSYLRTAANRVYG